MMLEKTLKISQKPLKIAKMQKIAKNRSHDFPEGQIITNGLEIDSQNSQFFLRCNANHLLLQRRDQAIFY